MTDSPTDAGAPSTGVSIKGITKRFGDLVAVNNVSIEVQPGEFFSLLGPSGCGKTTLLRLIAGFEKPDAGSISFGGKDVTGAPPQERPSAMVFQNYALFPTMTVAENVAYGLQVRRQPKATRDQRIAEALQRVRLVGMDDKPVTQLSGGQQQRVALARALAVQPNVLLFDEPLSNLDVALREQTRAELKLLQDQLGTTSVYVTHDQQEALALSDRIAVMRDGRLLQVGSPEQLYNEPQTDFVANFLGGSNIIYDATFAQALVGEPPPSAGMVLAVRPEHLRISSDKGVSCTIRSRQFLGLFAELILEKGDQRLRAWVQPQESFDNQVHLTAEKYRWVRQDQP